MCGRFAQVIGHKELKRLTDELKIKETTDQIEINYNVAPTNMVAAIVAKDAIRYVGFFRWGLIPSWSKTIPSQALINVRKETIMEKPSFKASFSRRRCLVPANGFYEWRKNDKQPFFVQAAHSDLIYLAAIYDTWSAPDGSFIPSLGIITTAADKYIQPLHNRMPLLLPPSLSDLWLNPHAQNPDDLRALLSPAPEIELNVYPVDKRINNPQSNDSDCLKPIQLPSASNNFNLG